MTVPDRRRLYFGPVILTVSLPETAYWTKKIETADYARAIATKLSPYDTILSCIPVALAGQLKPIRQRTERPQSIQRARRRTGKFPTETEMKPAKMNKTTPSIRREAQNLEVRYGEIGISAVVAAVRYQTDLKAPPLVPAESQPDRRLNETTPEFAA
jgi:hypothetical protein